jgi:CubicO group peptidase (beta-lactamase class C family)
MRLNRHHRRLAAAMLISSLACGAAADDFQVPTAETDPLMARNFAAMMKQPGVLDLEWRQPKEPVDGAPRPLPALTPEAFPAPEALASVRAYSDANSGKGIMVWYRGNLVDAYFAEGVTEETFFGAFSMHKSVLALMLLAAVEDGFIGSLDDGAGTYIPSGATMPAVTSLCASCCSRPVGWPTTRPIPDRHKIPRPRRCPCRHR